jgi:hypothetical protein
LAENRDEIPFEIEHLSPRARAIISAYYMKLTLAMKKKKHGQLPSAKEMFKWRTKTCQQEE